jgi:hypothetical protein
MDVFRLSRGLLSLEGEVGGGGRTSRRRGVVAAPTKRGIWNPLGMPLRNAHKPCPHANSLMDIRERYAILASPRSAAVFAAGGDGLN